MKGKVIFEEEQSFLGTWVWYLIVGISSISIIGTGLGLYFSRDAEGIIGLVIAAIVTLGIVILFYTCRLYTSIDKSTIYYRFPPFVNSEKTIIKEDVKEIYVRKYSPISEYGGWGYRYSFKNGRALNTVGDEGLQIIASNDKKILIGTQKPDQLRYAVKKLKENWEMK